MASKNSNLNLLKAQQSKKEVVQNNLSNAMSPAAFGGKNEDASNLLVFGVYGGRRNGSDIPNQTVNITASTEGWVYFDESAKNFQYSTSEPVGNFYCYKVKADAVTVTDWFELRDGYSGGGGGSSDNNFKSKQTASVEPIASGAYSIAIGDSAIASGERSISFNEGEATGMLSISFGRNNKAFATRAAVLGGSSNRIDGNSRDSTIIGGNSNYIQGWERYFTIINSVSCRIKSGIYELAAIINSSQAEIAASSATIINSFRGYIDTDATFSTIIGCYGYISTPYTFQAAFGQKIRKDFTGFSELGSDTTAAKLIIGDNLAYVKRFLFPDNTVMFFKVTLLGIDTSNNNVCKLSTEITVKRFSRTTSFVNESGTSKALTLDFGEGSLSGVSASIDIENTNEININATGVAGSSIRWNCLFDTISVNK